MRKNLFIPITTLDNIVCVDSGDGSTLFVSTMCINVLLAVSEQDQPLSSGKDKLERFLLAQRISLAPESVDLKPEDIVLIKNLIGKYASPLVVGRVFPILDNE